MNERQRGVLLFFTLVAYWIWARKGADATEPLPIGYVEQGEIIEVSRGGIPTGTVTIGEIIEVEDDNLRNESTGDPDILGIKRADQQQFVVQP